MRERFALVIGPDTRNPCRGSRYTKDFELEYLHEKQIFDLVDIPGEKHPLRASVKKFNTSLNRKDLVDGKPVTRVVLQWESSTVWRPEDRDIVDRAFRDDGWTVEIFTDLFESITSDEFFSR